MDIRHGLRGEGPWQRFIVKFRPGSGPGRDPGAARSRLQQRGAPDANIPQLAWQRRLGVGADLVLAARPLDRSEAGRLLEALAADPEVEYVEVDAMMQALTHRGGPPARP